MKSENDHHSLATGTLTVDDIRDDQLKSAAIQAERCGSCLPILKQELKYKIQAKRLSQGKQELQVEFRQPKQFPLSQNEVIRRDKRKLINKVSARKCRRKKKEEFQHIQMDLNTLEERNSSLRSKIQDLEQAKEELLDRICQTLLQCQIKISHNAIMTVAPKFLQKTEGERLYEAN